MKTQVLWNNINHYNQDFSGPSSIHQTFLENHSDSSCNSKTSFLKMLIDTFLVYISSPKPVTVYPIHVEPEKYEE